MADKPHMSKDQIAELAKEIRDNHLITNNSLEAVEKTIEKWQNRPEPDVLELDWNPKEGVSLPLKIWIPGLGVIKLHFDFDLDEEGKQRVLRAIAKVPQMYKLCRHIKTLVGYGLNRTGEANMVATSILDSIDNK